MRPHAQAVAEDGAHAGDLIREKLRDLEAAFAEGVDDRGWISGVREADAFQQLAGVPPVFCVGQMVTIRRKAGLGT